MKKTIGFIGCGNMGEAILKGMLEASIVSREQVYVSCLHEESKQRLQKTYGVHTAHNKEVAKQCDIIVLAIKPYQFEEVIAEIQEEAKEKLLVSVAAGVTLAQIQQFFHTDHIKAIRMMPNTPACVKEAMSSMSANACVSEEEKREVFALFSSFGKVVEVEEEKIHAVIAASGSSPAYLFMILDAMIQNSVKHGLPEKEARLLCSQAVLGAAKMVQDSEEKVDTLKVNVCSPNGTTIEAVHSLEADGIYEIIDRAMDACYEKSIKMSE